MNHISPVISKQVADIYKATSVFPFRHWRSGVEMVILVIGHLIRGEQSKQTNTLATYKKFVMKPRSMWDWIVSHYKCVLYLIQPPLRVLCEICGY
jgi:hypothetical protein